MTGEKTFYEVINIVLNILSEGVILLSLDIQRTKK